MLICKVQGKCVSTIKHKAISGHSLIGVQKINEHGETMPDLFIAADPLGCSVGELVLVTAGSSARIALNDPLNPVDLVVVGIIDHCDFTQA